MRVDAVGSLVNRPRACAHGPIIAHGPDTALRCRITQHFRPCGFKPRRRTMADLIAHGLGLISHVAIHRYTSCSGPFLVGRAYALVTCTTRFVPRPSIRYFFFKSRSILALPSILSCTNPKQGYVSTRYGTHVAALRTD